MAKLILVAGSWGSGTTSVIGALHHLGVHTPGPFFKSNDPRTVNTYEMLGFRQLLLRFIEENTLKFKNNYQQDFLPALMGFKSELELQLKQQENPPDCFALKLPLANMFIPEIVKVFDTRLIMVHRPFHEIENSRARRNWPVVYGEQGARIMYSKFTSDVITQKQSFLGVSYSDFLKEPAKALEEILHFCGKIELKNNIPQALDYIRSE